VTEEREGVLGVNEVIGVIAIRVADGGLFFIIGQRS
jgi:hypothetical protein